MKKSALLLVLFFVFISVSRADNGQTYAMIREWAGYAGITDSTFKTPVVSNELYTYVAATVFDSVSGPDISIIKYNSGGDRVWTYNWTGAGGGA